MIRKHANLIAAFVTGFVLAAAMMYAIRPQTREAKLYDLAEEIADQIPGVKTEITREDPAGLVLNVSMDSTSREYIGLARIEIGYEGQFLPSIWSSKTGYYAYHFGKSATESDIVERVRRASEMRLKTRP